MLSRLSIRTQFALLLIVVTPGFVAFGLGARRIQGEIKVGGPVYGEIVRSKDLVADILPPPSYIIESHLTAMQMLVAGSADEQRRLADRLKHLRGEYDERHAYWTQAGLHEELNKALNEEAHGTALRYYDLASIAMCRPCWRAIRPGSAPCCRNCRRSSICTGGAVSNWRSCRPRWRRCGSSGMASSTCWLPMPNA